LKIRKQVKFDPESQTITIYELDKMIHRWQFFEPGFKNDDPDDIDFNPDEECSFWENETGEKSHDCHEIITECEYVFNENAPERNYDNSSDTLSYDFKEHTELGTYCNSYSCTIVVYFKAPKRFWGFNTRKVVFEDQGLDDFKDVCHVINFLETLIMEYDLVYEKLRNFDFDDDGVAMRFGIPSNLLISKNN
jgi:hypothetical protein